MHINLLTYYLYLWVLGWFAICGGSCVVVCSFSQQPGSVENTDAHDKSVLGIKGDIFAIEEDDKDWVKGGSQKKKSRMQALMCIHSYTVIHVPWKATTTLKKWFILDDDKSPLKKKQWFGKPTYNKRWLDFHGIYMILRFPSIGTWVWNDEMHLTKDNVEQSAPKTTPIHTASQETKDSTDESEAKKKVETETWCCFKTMSHCTHLPEISVVVFTFAHILLHCMWRKWWQWWWWFVGSCYWLTSLNFGLIDLSLTKATQECFAMGGDSDSVPWFGWLENPVRWCWMWSVKKGFQGSEECNVTFQSVLCCQLDTSPAQGLGFRV